MKNPWVIACWVAVAAACAFLLFGPAPGAVDNDAAVKKTMNSYVRAFVKGDDKAACDQLTDSAKRAVLTMAEQIGARSCPGAFKRTREIGGKKVAEITRKIEVHKVRVKGNTASVELRVGSQDSVAELEKIGDHWKISSLPRS